MLGIQPQQATRPFRTSEVLLVLRAGGAAIAQKGGAHTRLGGGFASPPPLPASRSGGTPSSRTREAPQKRKPQAQAPLGDPIRSLAASLVFVSYFAWGTPGRGGRGGRRSRVAAAAAAPGGGGARPAQRQPPRDWRFEADSVPAGTGDECDGARARREALPGGAAAVAGRGMRLDGPAAGGAGAASLTAQRLMRELPPPAVAGRAFLERWPGVSPLAPASGAAGRSWREDSRRLLRGGGGAARQGRRASCTSEARARGIAELRATHTDRGKKNK
jgi:hypothetical protein